MEKKSTKPTKSNEDNSKSFYKKTKNQDSLINLSKKILNEDLPYFKGNPAPPPGSGPLPPP